MKLRVREDDIQRSALRYLETLPDLFVCHVPNGGHRDVRVARILKGLGVKPGVADLMLLWPGRGVGFIELKTPKGRQSAAQADFQALCARMGHRYEIARGLDDVERIASEWGLVPRRGYAS